MLYFYVNQSKNVGKVGKIMFDFMGKCRYNKSLVCGGEGKLQIG